MQVEDRSPIRFARVEGAAIAYQTWGDGPARVVIVPPLAQNIELAWERPEYRALFARLGRFAHMLHFDKRGTGASDRTDRMPTIDQRVEDLVAVMDAAGFDRAHVLGLSEGGPVALALAATYPERVETLTLFGSGARTVVDDDEEDRARRLSGVRYFHETWGTDESVTLDAFGPSVAGDPSYRAWQPRYERQSATPAALGELLDMIEAIDVRPLLESVTVPVLVMHRRDDPIVPVALAREAAALLPDARLVELEGRDHFVHVGDIDSWVDHSSASSPARVAPRREPVRRPGRPHRHDGGLPGLHRRRAGAGQRVGVPPGAPGLQASRRRRGPPRPPRRAHRAALARRGGPGQAQRPAVGGALQHPPGPGRRDRRRPRRRAARPGCRPAGPGRAERGDRRRRRRGRGRACTGPVLPEDAYEDWATAARDRFAAAVASARRRLAADAVEQERWDEVVDHARAMIELDEFDERAHELLVRALVAAGRRGEAKVAVDRYRACMAELGVQPRDLLDTTPGI